MNIEDHITHIAHEEDDKFLRNELFEVNMRLFKSSEQYRLFIQNCAKYIATMCATTMDGYKKPHGMSGANCAIPFNIIAITRNRNQDNEWVEVMLNPIIVSVGKEKVATQSNCGSIRLKEPISIKRYKYITVQWNDVKTGNLTTEGRGRKNGGFTIQHEVDHNLGILITDRTTKEITI